MSTRPSSRPGITEQWPKHRGNIVMSLDPLDKVYFRMVNERCNPEIVGSGNAGKHCTVIIGHKEVDGVQKVKEMRGVEEFSGVSVRISKHDDVYTCLIDSTGRPSSLGVGNAGKEVTVIVHSDE